jgi:hypothetical protein
MHGVHLKLIELVKSIYDKSEAAVRHDRQMTELFGTFFGLRQGCILSSDLFNLMLEAALRLSLENEETRKGLTWAVFQSRSRSLFVSEVRLHTMKDVNQTSNE